jgi:DNA-binding response OmpR family regulator
VSKETILIVDDEREILDLLHAYLVKEGFEVVQAANGLQALNFVRQFQPNLIVLDILLPDLDGFELCRTIRQEYSTPIIMLTCRSEEVDKILGLGLGADDYVTKPFSPRELVARVKAHLRRSRMTLGSQSPQIPQSKKLVFPGLVIDPDAHEVRVEGVIIDLSPKEFQLLCLLASNPKRVFTKEQLYNLVWGYCSGCDEKAVAVYVARIREKLKNFPAIAEYIKTVWGIGYKFEAARDNFDAEAPPG